MSPEHVVESHIPAAVQPLHLIAHVLEEQLVFVQVHLQPAAEETEQELHPGRRDHALGGEEVAQGTSLEGIRGCLHFRDWNWC